MKQVYTYFWKTLPIGDLILLALISLAFSKSSQILQPPQMTWKVLVNSCVEYKSKSMCKACLRWTEMFLLPCSCCQKLVQTIFWCQLQKLQSCSEKHMLKYILCTNEKLQLTSTPKLQSLQQIMTATLIQCQCENKPAVNVNKVVVNVKRKHDGITNVKTLHLTECVPNTQRARNTQQHGCVLSTAEQWVFFVGSEQMSTGLCDIYLWFNWSSTNSRL